MAFTETVNRISGITGQSVNSFLGRLKEEFIPAWEDHVHKKLVIAKKIATKRGTMGGRRSLTSVLTSYPQSAGIALFEGDNLPTPRTPTYVNPSIFSRSCYSRMRWTGHVERAARKGDKVAWAAPRSEDLRTARIQFELNFARMLYLGPRQLLATVVSYEESGDASATLYNRNARDSQSANRHKYGAHYLRNNMSIAFTATVDGVPNPLVATEIFIDPAKGGIDNGDATGADPVVGLSAAVSTDPSDGQFVIPYRSRLDVVGGADADQDSNFAGPNGLMNMAVDNTIHRFIYGLDRTGAANRSFEAFMINNGSGGVRPFSEDYITLAVDRVTDDGTGDDPDVVICHKSVRREYVRAVSGDRRFPEIVKNRGFKDLKQTVDDVTLPMVTDRDCMPGVMWVLESEGFGWFSEADLQMADEGERFVDNKDARELVFVKAGNGATRKPHNNAMVDDIEYSVTGLTAL